MVEFVSSHFHQLIAEKIRSIEGQKAHCICMLDRSASPSWASKEYSELIEQYDHTLVELNNRLRLMT